MPSFSSPFSPNPTVDFASAPTFAGAQIPGLKSGRLYYGGQALNKFGRPANNKQFFKGGAFIVLSSWVARFFNSAVRNSESVMGQSHTRFAQDTATVLGGKLTAVRSPAEAAEAFFLEFVESALFYYSVPFIGKYIREVWHALLDKDSKQAVQQTWLDAAEASQAERLAKKARDAAGDSALKFSKKQLDAFAVEAKRIVNQGVADGYYKKAVDAIQTSAKELGLNKKVAFEQVSKGKRALTALKGATIFSVLSVVVMEYSLNFVKNLMTLKAFKKGDFTDVVNLTDNSHTKELHGEHPTETKAKAWIRNCALIAGGILAGAVGLVKGRDKQWVYHINKRLVKIFDFSYAHKMIKNKKGIGWFPQLKMGLGAWQMRAIIMLGGLGYLHASRDKLELKENFFRVQCVVVPYLAFGQDALVNLYGRIARSGKLGPNLKKGFELIKGEKTKFSKNPIARFFQKLIQDKYTMKSDAEVVEVALKKAGIYKKYSLNNYAQLLAGKLSAVEKKAMIKDLKVAYTHLKPYAKAKTSAFVVPFAFGVGVVGITVAWMNRFWTQTRFNKIQTDKATAIFTHIGSGLNQSHQVLESHHDSLAHLGQNYGEEYGQQYNSGYAKAF